MGLVKEEMVFFSLFPKPQGAVSGFQMPDQLHSEAELCELLVGFVLLVNEQEVKHPTMQ
jgi:hypothetical protein